MLKLLKNDVIGLVRPSIDVHTLGIQSFAQIIEDCGFRALIADEEVCSDLERLSRGVGGSALRSWLKHTQISILGFSYRLDPGDAERIFERLHEFLLRERLFVSEGGMIRGLIFAGLPESCSKIEQRYPKVVRVFKGDETPLEILEMVGISSDAMPQSLAGAAVYDAARLRFGEEIVKEGRYFDIQPVARGGYPSYGMRGDKVENRIRHGMAHHLPPLVRAHVGPYLPARREAVKLFLEWVGQLASGGFLDVLSIGSSQLTQDSFGEDWEGRSNGGGVPINTAEEYAQVWKAARPMLVRTYAGTKNVPSLARIYEETIDIAWHALSFWWFCQIDGRGPNTVLQNLNEHFETMRFIAASGKPLEPNVPHHFAFRGSDDLGYVVSGYVAAKAAKLQGIRTLILQTMLNTPKYTWGIQDLAKARVLLRLVRSLEGPDFKVYLQPRGGLDYFSPDPAKAKAQLAAVTALMDDIEPHDETSPQIIHVVSYSEAYRLADPPVIEESIKISRYALQEYRRLKREGKVDDMARNDELKARESALFSDAKKMISAVESLIVDAYSPAGFYTMLSSGVFALPWLSSCRDEFAAAVSLHTRIVNGGVSAVDRNGVPIPIGARIELIQDRLRKAAGKTGGANGS